MNEVCLGEIAVGLPGIEETISDPATGTVLFNISEHSVSILSGPPQFLQAYTSWKIILYLP